MDISSAILDPELGCTAFTVERIYDTAERYLFCGRWSMWEYEETAQRLLRGEIESDEHHAASAHGEADKVTKEQRGWARD